MTLAHLACALGSTDVVQVLLNQNASRNGIWASKDDEGECGVCVHVCVCGEGGGSGLVSMCLWRQ